MNNRVLELFVKNIEQDQKLRNKYAMILIGILAIELIVLMTIFVLKGCKVLEYSDGTLNIFVSGGIAEVFLLVRVIVKYLFKDNLTEAFKIILRNNNKGHTDNKKFNKHNKFDKP